MEIMSYLFKLKILNKEIFLVGLFLFKYGKIIFKDDFIDISLIGNF